MKNGKPSAVEPNSFAEGEPWNFMALLMLRNSGFHGSPYAKELRVPWLSLC